MRFLDITRIGLAVLLISGSYHSVTARATEISKSSEEIKKISSKEPMKLSFNGGSVTFPVGWVVSNTEGNNERFIVENPDVKNVRVTISVMYFKPEAQNKEVFAKLLGIRLKAEKEGGGPEVTISTPSIRELHGDTYAAKYEGNAFPTRFFRTNLLMKNGIFLTEYIEKLGDEDKKYLDNLSHDLFENVQFDGPI